MQPVIASIWELLEDEIFTVPSQLDGRHPYLNLYRDSLPGIEHPQAACIRRQNLEAYLEHFTHKPATLILGEAPGWRGCRFSGVPFTSEAQLTSEELPFFGKSTSRLMVGKASEGKTDQRASINTASCREASATIFWRELTSYSQQFLVWNVFPFHSHNPGEPQSNRKPGWVETQSHLSCLQQLISYLEPERILAVGNFAQQVLKRQTIPCLAVRHPSHGGAHLFKEQVLAYFAQSSARSL